MELFTSIVGSYVKVICLELFYLNNFQKIM